MTKLELAQNIYQKMNPNTFGIDPVLIASIVSIIIQIIKLIYEYKHPEKLYNDVNNIGFLRNLWLKYKITYIIFQSRGDIECGQFLEAFRTCLKGKTIQQLQQLIGDCE